MSRLIFVHEGVEYFAVRGPKEIVLVTRGRITDDQYYTAIAIAKSIFRELDQALKHSIKETIQ